MYVGKERIAYRLHKDLLISKCPYFRASLSSGFPEGKTNEVHLAEDVPAAFNVFVQWLYSGTFSPMETANDVSVKTRAYVMADALLTVEFKNDLVDFIRQWYIMQFMGAEILTVLAKNDAFHGQLKCFALDQLACNLLSAGDKPKQSVCYSPDGTKRPGIDAFLAEGSSTATEMFWALHKFGLTPYDDPSKREGCHYHEHPAESPACKSAAEKDEGEA